MNKLVFFDLETGGLDPFKHPIIQIAAIAVDEQTFDELDSFEVKIAFDKFAAEPEVLKRNSYDPEVWEKESIFDLHALIKLSQFLKLHATVPQTSKKTGREYKVARLAGHNADRFDGVFLKEFYHARNEFLPAAFAVLCTVQLARWYFLRKRESPENCELGTLCKFFSIPLDNAHDALADVRATVALAKTLKDLML